MTIIDIHTHHSGNPQSLQSVLPSQFAPQLGMHYAVGLHPWHLDVADEDALHLLEWLAGHEQVFAIGETGLDSLRGPSLDVQRDWLRQHINIARQVNKPLIVHMVRTSRPLLDEWHAAGAPVPLVVHGMRGNAHVARTLLEAGCHLSYGIHFNPDALRLTPRDRLFIETDDAPASIMDVARRVAPVVGMEVDDLIEQVARNAHHLFGQGSAQ